MLGIFLIICLAVFWFIELKKYRLFKDDHVESVELGSAGRTYNVCSGLARLNLLSYMVVLVGYIGCAWPFLFIDGIERNAYLFGMATFGFAPIIYVAIVSYFEIKNASGYVKISTEGIEYKRRKFLIAKVSDMKMIGYPALDSYQIHLKGKRLFPFNVNLNGFHKKKEIRSLMKQLREHCDKENARKRSLARKLSPWVVEIVIGKYYRAFWKTGLSLLLLYSSYCCIDYDFFKKDYVAEFNALNTEAGQTENAWEYYILAAKNYVELEDEFQWMLQEGVKSGGLDLTLEQKAELQKWFDDNKSSWESLKKAAAIGYCNASYDRISIFDDTDENDFSSPVDSGYGQIKHFYTNANVANLAGVIHNDWLELFEMELASSRHFVNGKSLIDQLVGYRLLGNSIVFIVGQGSYELEDLQEVRALLKDNFPEGVPELSVDGEIYMTCSLFDHIVNLRFYPNSMKIPVQTPLNPVFLLFGSTTGAESHVRKSHSYILNQARKGIEVEPEEFSIISFPIMKQMLFSILEPSIGNVYKYYQRADTNLLAAYFLLDLEEYYLMKGSYPVDVLQLREAGFESQLPVDPDSDGKIVYRNDGQMAILYAVGRNGEDDGGFRDDKDYDEILDDIIYWQRDL